MKFSRLLFLISILTFPCLVAKQADDWKHVVKGQLPLMGHRNWIVVADSAYPLQTTSGIETIFVDEDQLQVVETVMGLIKSSSHVQPTIYVDKELEFVSEKLAPGVSDYRKNLSRLLAGTPINRELHEDIIRMLDVAGNTFRILLIKTPLAVPYTSVFFRLECGYWTAESESALREAMKP
ncbi:MAG: hypothetical protein KJT03_11415 [Verrucomicrobiae bacterium]|nr:hypothetical protein [Verrucomicrobiae bacterium]